jgi:heme/copper-type cytochrome/quinol oxidase subunit 3
MNTLRLLIDICLLRGKAQDLPAAVALVVLTALAGILVDYLSLPERGFHVGRLLFVVSQTVLFGAGLWLVLKLRGFPARWTQTVTALYAANAAFSLLLLPFLPALAETLTRGQDSALGWQMYLVLAVSGWFVAVMARVLREAMESSLLAAFVATLALIFAVRVAGLALAPLFGLHVAAE